MRITLTQGQVAIVDDEDFDYLNQWTWYAAKMGKAFYVVRHSRKSEYTQPTTIRMHRVIMQRMDIDSPQVDHVDRNPLNNRRANLRPANPSENMHNRGLQSNNKSGYVGVSWHKRDQKWQAGINHHGKRIHLGLYDDPAEASEAYKQAKRKRAGAYAPKEIQ